MANFNFEYMGDYLQYKDSHGNTLIINGGIINETATGAVAEFTDGAKNIPVKSLTVTLEPIQSGTGDPSPENVRPISGRSTVNIWREATYDTSADPVLTIQLGQTVYGGTVDVVSGKMVVDRAMVDMGTLTWIYNSTTQVFWSNIDQMKRPGTLVCSQYAYQPNGNVENLLNGEIWNRGYAYNANNIVVKDTVYADAATFKTAMNGVQLCYELAEPITITLTPEQLTTLLGTNNIWSDADSVSVDYVADTKLYIQNAIANSVSDSN